MFVMKSSVRQRTMIYPANEGEEAVEAVLRTLRTDTRAAKDLLQAEGQHREELAELAEQIRTAVGSLVDRWPRLERQSPYRLAALDEAIGMINELADLGEASGRRAAPVDFEDSLGALLSVKARALLSERLRAARGSRSVRSTARDLHVALGYLSDLESGRAGPPSASVLEKLADGLAIDLSDVAAAIARAEAFKDAHRRRVAQARRVHAATGARTQEDIRLGAFSGSAEEDLELLDLIEAIRRLPAELQRALRLLVTQLAAGQGERRYLRG